jgi:Protein of unknown function (DUF1236)
MSKAKLLTTAAAMVIMTGGIALAQNVTPGGKDNPGHAPAAQQNAPAEKVAPAIQHGQRKLPATTGQATPDRVEPGHGANVQVKPQHSAPATSGQDSQNHGSKAKQGAEIKAGAGGQGREHSERNGRADSNEHRGGNADHNRVTTGQGAAGSAHLSSEQRSRMSTVFHRHRDHRIDKARLNISIRVGTRVPTSVRFYPVPVEIVEIYPEWRGYDYVYVGDEILIVDPRTHEIVAIIEA